MPMRELAHAAFRAPVRSAFIPFALCAALFGGAYASAQEYSMRDVGGWTVVASKDKKGCFLSRTYAGPGETTLLLGLDIDGSNHLSVLNDNWSIKPDDRLELNFRLSNGGYSKHPVVGMASEEKKGFVTSFETKFISYFATSKALHISRDDVPVEQLSLDGSGAAVAELQNCVGVFKTKTAAGGREERRSDDIPRDPFAPDAKRGSKDQAGER
jgi:hypothetical protein